MGEYATYKGQEVKIGTCESMYYLRYDQRTQVQRLRGNVDPVKDAEALRFRFPWPDEDGIEPGGNEFWDNGFERAVTIPGLTAEPDVDHQSVQFVAQAGYALSLTCPESSDFRGGPGLRPLELIHYPALRVHRNGFSGAVKLVAQRYRPEIGLVPVLMCGGCGTMWRVEDRAKIEEIAVLLRAEGDRTGSQFWHKIADRVLAGLAVIERHIQPTNESELARVQRDMDEPDAVERESGW